MIDIHKVITDSGIFSKKYISREGFHFTSITNPHNVYDAIIIKYPHDVPCNSPRINGSSKSLEEHIEFINNYKIEKAMIISDNIDFIVNCPTLKYLSIIPADSSKDKFDYSPLYKMPQIKSLRCKTIYGSREELSTCIDCAKINALENIHITNSGYENFNSVLTLTSLGLTNYCKNDLSEAFESSQIDTLSIFQSRITTLDGIEKSQKMQCVYLYHNRILKDIDSLRKIKGSLKALRIESCPKIDDFSVLGELENLEFLSLYGSNELPNLNFIKKLKNLKTFVFNMNVQDGDLTPCLNLSYVYCDRNRKHYTHKDKDLPKGEYVCGNESIEPWRRLY